MTRYQTAPVPRVTLTKRQVECLRTLMSHALDDIDFGAGGTYAMNPGDAQERINENEVKRAREAIQLLALIIENRNIN